MSQERLQKLKSMFQNMDNSVITAVLDANPNDDAAIDQLLFMQNDPMRSMVVPAGSNVRHVAAPPANAPGANPQADAQARDLQNLRQMFQNNSLTVSVISTVYQANAGNLQGAVDTLLNIQQCDEAIAQIRQLSHAQAQKYEQEMQANRERVLKEREAEAQRAVEEKRRRLEVLQRVKEAELERRRQEEAEAKRLKAELEKRMREAEDAKIREEELQRQKEMEERKRAEEAAKKQILEAEREKLAEQQRKSAEAARAAQEADKADKAAAAAQLLEAEQAARRKLEKLGEQLLLQENELKEKEEEIARQKEILRRAEEENERLRKEAAICTLAVQYSAKQSDKDGVVVVWALNSKQKPTSSDWVGFFKVGSPNKQYIKYIATYGTERGHEVFETPSTPGLYEFRFFLGGSYEDVARSDAIHIGPQLEMHSELLEAEGKIVLRHELKGGALSTKDWIGFYRKDKSNKQYTSSHYLRDHKGVIEVPMPRRPAEYEFRFFPYACGYTYIAASNVIVVPNRDKLNIEPINDAAGVVARVKATWDIHSVDLSSWDWVALYPISAPNNYYEAYKYADQKNRVLEFELPRIPGEYELRYHSKTQSKTRDIARSTSIVVPDRDAVSAKYDGGYLKVDWKIFSVDVTSSDWIGVYKAGENSNYVDFKYADPRTGFVIFDKPAAGTYEAKFFSASRSKTEPLKKSAPVVIA